MGVETAIALAGLGLSAYQGIKGAQATAAANKAAEQASENLSRIQEQNKFESLKVPTLGTELAQQNLQARQASNIQALQEGGAATVLGGLTKLGLQSQEEDLQLAANADQMQYQRDQMLAQNAQQLEQNRVQREFGLGQMKLTGAQTAAAEGRQQVNAAMAGGLQSLSNAAQMKMYKDIYGKGDDGKGSNFLGNLGYSLGLGGTNATPVSETAFKAQEAFKPTIQNMAPNNIQPQLTNPGLTSMQAGLAQQQQLNALRDPQAQFGSQYRWNPYTGQWGLR